MSNEYKISTLTDIMNLDEDQIDRLCAELPRAIKYAKSLEKLFFDVGDALGAKEKSAQVLLPLTWTDDGKTEITVSATNGNEDLFEIKVGSIGDVSEQ